MSTRLYAPIESVRYLNTNEAIIRDGYGAVMLQFYFERPLEAYMMQYSAEAAFSNMYESDDQELDVLCD